LTVQGFFNGTLGGDGVTNLEGIANNAGNATINQPVGLRALYLQTRATAQQHLSLRPRSASRNPFFLRLRKRQRADLSFSDRPVIFSITKL